jgi:UDP-N-acetylmuramoyl-tripeptide--D-alanyl-D-alanine ligase
MRFTLAEIAEILECPPPFPPDGRASGYASGYSIDSRTLRPGNLFFAIVGQKLDGHDYVKQALDSGAAVAVIAADRMKDFPASARPKLLAVPDTLEALQRLAAASRRRWGGPLVAVTGSMGKTTTKQMIAALLRTRYRVLENEGNLNNHYGLPLSLLRLEPETEVGVFELAMSGPGEIRLLAALAAPDLGVVTNVGPVHLEFFPDVDAIARAKYELIETLGERAWAVLNADDPRVSHFGDCMPARAVYFGTSRSAGVRAEDLSPNGNGGWAFRVALALPSAVFGAVETPPGLGEAGSGECSRDFSDVRFHLPLLGKHNVLNALAALATGYLFGIPLAALQDAVTGLRPGLMRGEIVRLANGASIVNDCYNANPAALEAMLEAVRSLPAARRIAVLGGMFELGPAAESLCAQSGARLAELGFDWLITVGDEARAIEQGARSHGHPAGRSIHVASPQEAGAWLRSELREGDLVLLKASRAVHLESAWEQLAPFRTSGADVSGVKHQ